MVDTIPLHEIMKIEEMEQDESEPLCKELDRESKKKSLKHSIIQLKTVPDGFNFGKVYYLKGAHVDTPSRVVVAQLWEAAKSAKDRVERKSRFRKSQEAVLRLQSSLAFQSFVAVLIILVPSAQTRRGARRSDPP